MSEITALPSYTRTWHKTPYAAISPSRPELSAKGKTVVVTGGGQGIGRATAQAFAEAGAAHIALLSRRTAPLEETQASITHQWPSVRVTIHPIDVTDEQALVSVAKALGAWDVLVLNAGVTNALADAFDIQMEDWWRTFEINVKGSVLTARTFFPTQKPEAKVITVSSAAFVFPSAMLRGTSAYNVSKLAQGKAMEFLAAEYPDTFFGIVQPGLIETELVTNLALDNLPEFDSIELGANFVLWMASPEAAFLRAKFVYANFDVDELKAQAEQLQTSTDLMIGINGLKVF